MGRRLKLAESEKSRQVTPASGWLSCPQISCDRAHPQAGIGFAPCSNCLEAGGLPANNSGQRIAVQSAIPNGLRPPARPPYPDKMNHLNSQIIRIYYRSLLNPTKPQTLFGSQRGSPSIHKK